MMKDGGAPGDALTFYKDPPSIRIALDEFETLAVERLKVLRQVEDAVARGGNERDSDVSNKMRDFIKSTHLAIREADDKRKDNISHWVLRLAFSSTEELRRRFLAFEVALFKFRYKTGGSRGVERFMRDNNLGYEPISPKEVDEWHEELRAVFMSTHRHLQARAAAEFDLTTWYKVKFTEVLSLVASRRVFVRAGFAYVPRDQLISILSSRFRSSLSQKLAIAFKSLPFVKQDERIHPMMRKLQTAYLGPEYGKKRSGAIAGSVTPDTIDLIAQSSFPMCMRILHGALKRNHHLRYHGRLQFRLFLKGLGLSMEDCLSYFSREFCKKGMTPEKFYKDYAYNIRHSYGKEGKRADYTPHNCVRIILGPSPGDGEYHGCPFKSFDVPTMRRQLSKQRQLRPSDIDAICDSMASKNFGIACRRHFEASHPGAESDGVGNHPNAWYEASVAHKMANAGADCAKVTEALKPAPN